MRPLRLTVEGFTCFKERQAPLDLSGLELFAIAGPTGAGKSSLLDAIIFALYGRVPRMRRGYSELISLGRDRMSVLLDFRVGQREFRITRTGRRARSTEAQLDELVDGQERSIAGGVQSVDNEVLRLLGLRYEAFTQAVVLPQGDFARFLKSQPRERREILRDLLRFQVYERMRKNAADCSRSLELKLSGVRERLREDYGEVSPQQIEELERRLLTLDKRNHRASEELASLQSKVEERRARYQRTRELVEKRIQLVRLRKRQSQIETIEEKLAAARRVAPLLPLMEGAAAAERRSEDDGQRALAASHVLRKVRADHEDGCRRLEDARRQGEELPQLERRIRALDELKGLFAPRESAARRRDQARARQRELAGNAQGAEDEEKKARQRVELLARDVHAASQKLAGLQYDRELDRRLDAARDAASLLAAHREAAVDALAEAKEAEGRVSGQGRVVSGKKTGVEKIRKLLHRLTRARQKVEDERRKAEEEHAAAHLRGALERGKKCPVCEQPVTKLPPAIQVALLDVTAARLEKARCDEDRARSEMAREGEAEAHAQAVFKMAQEEAEKAERKAATYQETVERLERQLREIVGEQADDGRGATLEVRILSAIHRVAREREAYEQAAGRQDELERKLLESQGVLDKWSQSSQGLRQQAGEAQASVQEAEDELARLEGAIARVTGDPNPVKERDRLAARKEKIEASRVKAEEAERRTAAEFSAASKAQEEAERTAQESARRALEARTQVRETIKNAGFEEEVAVREAVLPGEEMSLMENEIASYRQERHAAEQREAELESELAGEEVSEQSQGQAEEELALRRRDYEDGLKKKAELEQEVKELRRRGERAAQLSTQQAVLEQEFSNYHRLANDLRSENFQAYLLEEAFRELVAGASVRLGGLSGRYTLEYGQDAFHVLDQENAGERRSADTLSGGETFLASLALALELSEQVQRAAGAVNLDSLFIDEGFGTLDPETLDTVASAIESLHVGGRMVGIITHIPELTQRLPACVWVEKHAEGSRVRQEVF